MSKVFSAYAQRKGVAITSLRFLIDGDRIDAAETPKSLELEDQDQSKCAGRVFLSFLFTLQRNYPHRFKLKLFLFFQHLLQTVDCLLEQTGGH